jgi:chromosome segregation ATPase
MNNYRRSLEYELRDRQAKIQALLPTYKQAETQYKDSEQEVYAKKREFEEAKLVRDLYKENFRTLHQPICHLKQEVGEIQDEMFNFAEDESGWTH